MASAYFTILDYNDRWAGKTIYSDRKSLFKYLLTKPREHIIQLVKFYGILNNPQFENYYRVLNIFIESCKDPKGRQLWERFYS